MRTRIGASGLVADLVGALLAARKRDDIAFLKVVLAFRGA